MREILSLHIGQSGIQVGDACWQLFSAEQAADTSNSNGFNCPKAPDSQFQETFDSSFFYLTSNGELKPRAIMIDLEPALIDQIRQGKNRHLFSDEHYIKGSEDAANNFARGFYTTGHEILQPALDRIRQFVECCSQLQAFALYHASGGGTGSGFTSLLLENLQQLYPKKSCVSFCTWPSPLITTAVVEPYNSVLTADHLLSSTEFTVLLDNQAIHDICRTSLELPSPSYSTLNHLISQVISAWTASLRFKGSLNVDIDEIQMNLVPYPRIHFLLSSYAPLLPGKCSNFQPSTTSVQAITAAAFQEGTMMAKCDPASGRYISCCVMYRGDVTPKDANAALASIRDKAEVQFVDWCPTGFKCGLNDRVPTYTDDFMAPVTRAVCMMSNNTTIQNVLTRTASKFDLLFARRAFVHWYINEGMEESEFAEARENLAALQKDYEAIENNFKFEDDATTDDYGASDTSTDV